MGDGLVTGEVFRERFEVRREIGRGARSTVFLAWDRAGRREVALKRFTAPPERVHRLTAEAAELAHHRLIVPREVLDGEPPVVLVLDYIAGSDLGRLVSEGGPLPPGEVAGIGRSAARALAPAHRRGILHGNLTPRNVLLGAQGGVWLTDLGTAPSGPAFVAPEVRAGQTGDHRSDICALGLVLYVALSGRLPEIPARALPDGLRVSLVRPGIPGWLDDAIARATALLPADRYSRISQFAEGLDGLRLAS